MILITIVNGVYKLINQQKKTGSSLPVPQTSSGFRHIWAHPMPLEDATRIIGGYEEQSVVQIQRREPACISCEYSYLV